VDAVADRAVAATASSPDATSCTANVNSAVDRSTATVSRAAVTAASAVATIAWRSSRESPLPDMFPARDRLLGRKSLSSH
jgi:hypothetical protein